VADRQPLGVPQAEPCEYEQNFIKLAVCELRFPVLLELEQTPPFSFQKSLRTTFPIYDRTTNVTVGPTSGVETQYNFRSKDQGWAVALKAHSLTLETTAYKTFEDFIKRLGFVMEQARPVFDSDFFTRLGLRYVNELPVGSGAIEGWVNPDLVRPLVNNVFGDVDSIWQEVRGLADGGSYAFRHGLAPVAGANTLRYFLDVDFFRDTVEVAEVMKTLHQLHSQSFSLFSWALGDKARDALGKARPKTR
jgi:uncharacterized protein (TIGR04255 family)